MGAMHLYSRCTQYVTGLQYVPNKTVADEWQEYKFGVMANVL